MATEFLNCGSPDVEQAAEEWAAANGYEVDSGLDHHEPQLGCLAA